MAKDLKILTSKNNLLIPSMGSPTSYAEGSMSLIQRIIKCLFTDPETNLFDDFGVGIQNVLPKIYNESELDSTKMSVTQSLLSLEKQIKQDDTLDTSDDQTNKLSSAFLKSLSFDAIYSEWVLEITVRNMANQSITFKVGAK